MQRETLKNRPDFTVKKKRKIAIELDDCKNNANNRHEFAYFFDDISSVSYFSPQWQSRRRILRIKRII